MQNCILGIIFYIVAGLLELIAKITGLTYVEINIIVYYILIPYSYFVLADYVFKRHYLKIFFTFSVIVFLIDVKSFRDFSFRLFDKSVLFLNSFGFLGMDYYDASVVICVFLALLIYVILIAIIVRRDKKKINLQF
jgi:hypothetical protein